MSEITDWLQAIGSILQAVCALVIGFAACVIARKANELAAAQIRPLLVIQLSLSPKTINISISNQGAGPATITKAHYCLIDKASRTELLVEDTGSLDEDTFSGLLDVSALLPRNVPLRDILDYSDPRGNVVMDKIAKSTIAAGEEMVLLMCQVLDTEEGQQYMSDLRAALHGARITIWYTDVRDGPLKKHRESCVQKRLSLQ